MTAVFIIISVLLGILVVFALCKLGALEDCIDDIYNKALAMQGEIESNTARSKDNYQLIAKVNTEVENLKSTIADLHKHEQTDEPAKEVESELENLLPEQEQVEGDEVSARRNIFAKLRYLGKSIKEAGELLGVSYSTAKRYEQWRKANKV